MECLKPQVESLLFAAVLLLLQPIQIEEVDRVLQSVGLNQLPRCFALSFHHNQPHLHIWNLVLFYQGTSFVTRHFLGQESFSTSHRSLIHP